MPEMEWKCIVGGNWGESWENSAAWMQVLSEENRQRSSRSMGQLNKCCTVSQRCGKYFLQF